MENSEQVVICDLTLVIFRLPAGFLARTHGRTSGRPFDLEADFFVESLSSAPSASRNTFSAPTITDGCARIGSRSSYLPLRRPDLYIEPSPCGGVRPAGDPVDGDP